MRRLWARAVPTPTDGGRSVLSSFWSLEDSRFGGQAGIHRPGGGGDGGLGSHSSGSDSKFPCGNHSNTCVDAPSRPGGPRVVSGGFVASAWMASVLGELTRARLSRGHPQRPGSHELRSQPCPWPGPLPSPASGSKDMQAGQFLVLILASRERRRGWVSSVRPA